LVPKEYVSLITIVALVTCLATSITSWPTLVALLICQPRRAHVITFEDGQVASGCLLLLFWLDTLHNPYWVVHGRTCSSAVVDERPAPDVEVEEPSTGQRLAQGDDDVGSSWTNRRKCENSTSSSGLRPARSSEVIPKLSQKGRSASPRAGSG
jgi:hypothetical protein